MRFLAHSANDAGRAEPVKEHLSCLADAASFVAREFDAETRGSRDCCTTSGSSASSFRIASRTRRE